MLIYSKNVFKLDGLPQILKDNGQEDLKEKVPRYFLDQEKDTGKDA